MSHIRTPGHPPTYRMRCDWPGCGAEHTSPVLVSSASDARVLARADGWRAPNASKRRTAGTPVDLCPDHRGATR